MNAGNSRALGHFKRKPAADIGVPPHTLNLAAYINTGAYRTRGTLGLIEPSVKLALLRATGNIRLRLTTLLGKPLAAAGMPAVPAARSEAAV